MLPARPGFASSDTRYLAFTITARPSMPPKKKEKGKERARDDDVVEIDKEEQAHNAALSFNGMSCTFRERRDRT